MENVFLEMSICKRLRPVKFSKSIVFTEIIAFSFQIENEHIYIVFSKESLSVIISIGTDVVEFIV